MENQFTRTELLLGPEAMERLSRSRVIVFGVGGVGGYVVEVLARSGVGMLALVDNDRVAPSNLNRQIIALHSTLGRLKVDVLEERIHDINPQCEVRKFPMFYLPENADAIQLEDYDYVVDCIDTVKANTWCAAATSCRSPSSAAWVPPTNSTQQPSASATFRRLPTTRWHVCSARRCVVKASSISRWSIARNCPSVLLLTRFPRVPSCLLPPALW